MPTLPYYHIELAEHALLLAEGVAAESYLDTGNRAFFANADITTLHRPEFMTDATQVKWEENACMPVLTNPEQVQPLWQALVDRAHALGCAPPVRETTTEADIHLTINGTRSAPIEVQDGHYVFMLPRGAADIRLISRASRPSDLYGYLNDQRSLGVRVSGLVLRAGAERVDVPADHPGLQDGLHTVEHDATAVWRWTNGDAALPIGALAQPAMLEIRISRTMTYVLPEAAQRLAA